MASFVILCIFFYAFNLKIILKRILSLHQMLRGSHGTDREGAELEKRVWMGLGSGGGVKEEGTPGDRTGREVLVGWEEDQVKADVGAFPGTWQDRLGSMLLRSMVIPSPG